MIAFRNTGVRKIDSGATGWSAYRDWYKLLMSDRWTSVIGEEGGLFSSYPHFVITINKKNKAWNEEDF